MEPANGLTRWLKVATLVAIVLGLIATLTGASSVYATKILGLQTTEAHDKDIERIEKKLDCALWNVPRGCMERLAPR